MINQKKIPALNNANLFFLRRLAPILWDRSEYQRPQRSQVGIRFNAALLRACKVNRSDRTRENPIQGFNMDESSKGLPSLRN
jgi:hypothetical protein